MKTSPKAIATLALFLAMSLLHPRLSLAAAAEHSAGRAAALLQAQKAELLLKRYEPSALRDKIAANELAKLKKLLLERDADNRRPAQGMAEEAYFSTIDQSPQPFYRYLPEAWFANREDSPPPSLPLLVFLHGYNPELNILNWANFAPGLTNLAEKINACLVCPFGRSNTDYQGIGEQDVLHVAELMHSRYGTDPRRVILIGHSMGAMGGWTLGARFAERFNGLLLVASRADYYFWHGVRPTDIPPWERAMVDDHFLPARAERLRDMPILSFHGTHDSLISIEEGRRAFQIMKPLNKQARLIEIQNEDHFILDSVLSNRSCVSWMREHTARPRASREKPLGIRPGATASRLQNAFLEPFLFVDAGGADTFSPRSFAARCREWERFAKAAPPQRLEAELRPEDRASYNLFVFGEPESSPLVAQILKLADIEFSADSLNLQGREIPRADKGLWFALPSPWGDGRTIALQCGVPWGAELSPNHFYDRLPDLIVYERSARPDGVNIATAAARVDDGGRFIWYDNRGE